MVHQYISVSYKSPIYPKQPVLFVSLLNCQPATNAQKSLALHFLIMKVKTLDHEGHEGENKCGWWLVVLHVVGGFSPTPF